MAATKEPKRRKLDVNRVQVGILKLLLDHSSDRLTFAKIAQELNVPRATLYYYFGNSREKMLEEAIRFGMQQFIQLDEFKNLEEFSAWKEFEKDRVIRSLRRIRKIPWMTILYFRYRNEKTLIGQAIRDAEEKYFLQMRAAWKHFFPKAPSLHGVRFAGYMKLGLFYGFSHDEAWWNSKAHRAERDAHLDRFLDFLQATYQA